MSNLQRMYGFFRCNKCHQSWESSHVYCSQGSAGTAQYGQECKKCDIMCMPYRVEKIKCSACGQDNCVCHNKPRNTDPNKPHRSDLCAKCRAGYPCK